MDAVRLIGASRRALAQCSEAADVMAEACRAQALAQAVGGYLAATGPPALRGEAESLAEVSSRGIGPPDAPGHAARLTTVGDLRTTLLALSALLGEVATALVGVVCDADDHGLYWRCVESMDAADESADRVHELLRRVELGEPGLPRAAGHV
ncbi:DUF6099 family protein [Streptomyces sp. NPDC060194]|uniref:DUF6099 family protein n=1 Tax=Streptomyces sp. NPDC060194 TaxID=3347069 RepID=UPI003665D8DE